MFNLIPKPLKHQFRKEYRMRRLVVVFILIICLQISFLIFMLPSWLESVNKERELSLEADRKNQNNSINTAQVVPTIKALNAKLVTLNNNLEYPEFTPYINLIVSQKTSQIKIKQFAYTSISSSTASITVSGIAGTRDSLVEFSKKIKDSKYFVGVDLPISNLAKDNDINFNMTLSINIDQKT